MESEISRRSFLKKSAIALGAVAVCDVNCHGTDMPELMNSRAKWEFIVHDGEKSFSIEGIVPKNVMKLVRKEPEK